jgi:esterase
MPVSLHHRQFSDKGFPLIILHGLFGQLGNWTLHARQLANVWQVYALDARNHGRSAWDPVMTYPAMAADLEAWMDKQGIDTAHIIGHSMGGKTAMEFALSRPQRMGRLIVVDIAPVAYGHGHQDVFDGLQAIDLAKIDSRLQADQQLAAFVESKPVRDFLLTNLVRDESGVFTWRMNLQALRSEYAELSAAPSASGPFQGQTLFVKGENSDYILPHHHVDIESRFPHAKTRSIGQAGHWVHSEKPAEFLDLVEHFLSP